MLLRGARRMPNSASSFIYLRRSFSSEDRRLQRTTLASVSMTEILFADMSIPASPFFLPPSPGIVCSTCVRKYGNVSGAVVEVVCETEVWILSDLSLLDVLLVDKGRRAGVAGVTHFEPRCRSRMIMMHRTHITTILQSGSIFVVVRKERGASHLRLGACA